MQIWVDADACPAVIRDILFRAAERTGVRMTLVANKPLRLPVAPNLRFLQVPQGFDAADKRIVELMEAGRPGRHRRRPAGSCCNREGRRRVESAR